MYRRDYVDLALIHQSPPRSNLGSPNNRIVPDVGLALACIEVTVTVKVRLFVESTAVLHLQNGLVLAWDRFRQLLLSDLGKTILKKLHYSSTCILKALGLM